MNRHQRLRLAGLLQGNFIRTYRASWKTEAQAIRQVQISPSQESGSTDVSFGRAARSGVKAFVSVSRIF